jgi:hypothetical protein
MSDLSSDFQEILGQVSKEFETAEVFSQWTPPDGTHTAVITGYNDGVSTKGGNKLIWWKVDNRIISPANPEVNEKEFSVFFRSNAVGFLKGAVATIAGRKIDDIRQAATILKGAVGYVVNIRVTTNDKGFKNYTYLDVVQKPA